VGDSLYANDGGMVKGYHIQTGENFATINLNASFLNGMTTDNNGHLYVTDFSTKRVYKITLADNSFTTLVQNTSQTPNGIAYDPYNQRLVVVTWGSNAPVLAIDPITGTKTTLTTTNLGNCDGITHDGCGTYYVSAWTPAGIYVFNNDFTEPPTLLTDAVASPADIDYDKIHHRIGILNSGNNTFTMEDIDLTGPLFSNPEDTLIAAANTDADVWLSTTVSDLDGHDFQLFISSLPRGLSAEISETKVIISGQIDTPGQYLFYANAESCLGLADTLFFQLDITDPVINGQETMPILSDAPFYKNQVIYSPPGFAQTPELLTVLDRDGKVLRREMINGHSSVLHLVSGLYIAYLQNESHRSKAIRFWVR